MEVGLCWILAVALCVVPLVLSQNCNEFARRPMDNVTAEGMMACLYCDYSDSDDIRWQRGSTSIDPGMEGDTCNCEAIAGRPISLCFPSVQREDVDRYTCHAQIGFGDTRICGAQLLLAGAPNITNKPANPDVVIASGATETITVNYDPGNPLATFQWSKDGQQINGSSDPRISSAPNSTILTLTNNNASIRGRYLVNASNIGGSDTFEYNVKAVFGPDITLTTSSLGNNHVRLTCSARGYPLLDRVAWQTDNGVSVSGSVDEINRMESATFDFSLTSTLDLERSRCDSHIYHCCVSRGSLTRSTSITCQIDTVVTPTPCRAPSTEVTGVSAELSRVGRRRAIRISWQRSPEPEVLGYRLHVSPNVPSPINIDGRDNTSYILVPSSCDRVMYSMFVQAWNGCASAGPSSATVKKECFSPTRIFIQNLIPHDTGITVNWESDRVDLLVNVFIVVMEQQVSSNNQPRTMTYGISDLMATERCVGGLSPETSYRVCVNATYRGDLDMQQDCNFSMTTRQLDEKNDGIQCTLPNNTTGTSQTVVVPDWVIAVIVVGVLMVIAALFCFIGLCFACRNSEEKGPNDFDSDSSIHTSSIRDGPMREMSPSRSCLSYHVKGHSVNWNEHVDTLRQMDTGGTSV